MKLKKNIEHITEYRKYTSKNPLIRLVISKFTNDILKQMKTIKPPIKIIDLGCGDGFLLKKIRKRFPDTVGFDISKDTLNFSRKLNPTADLIQGDIYHLPFKENTFGLSVILNVLEHLEQPEKALSEMRGVSKRYCLISVPYEPFFRLSNVMRLKYMANFGNYPYHLNHWGKSSFRKLLKKYFRKVNISSSTLWIIAFCEK